MVELHWLGGTVDFRAPDEEKSALTLLKPTHALISKHSFTFTLKH
jgi:hypothetical protein